MTSDRPQQGIKLRPYQQAVLDMLRDMPERMVFHYPARTGMGLRTTLHESVLDRWRREEKQALQERKLSIHSSAPPAVPSRLPRLKRVCYNVKAALQVWR